MDTIIKYKTSSSGYPYGYKITDNCGSFRMVYFDYACPTEEDREKSIAKDIKRIGEKVTIIDEDCKETKNGICIQ